MAVAEPRSRALPGALSTAAADRPAAAAPRPARDPDRPAAADPRPVLIGFADALAAPEAAWSLLDAGHPVVAFSPRGSRPALRRSRAVRIVEITSPREDARRSASDLRALVERGDFAAAMPLDDASVWLCDEALRSADIPIAGPLGELAELALDKRRQLEQARRAGLDVPPTQPIESVAELLELSSLPVVLKAARPVAETRGRLRRGPSFVCGDRVELRAAARAWNGSGTLLAQPLLSGAGEGLFGIAAPHRLLAVSAHRRLRMMNPSGSGSSACASAGVDDELLRGGERMLSAIGWSGMFMLEFLRGADGRAWFMELNGRPWGSMALARRLGLEYPAWAVRRLSDEDWEPPARPAVEGLVCRHLGRELVHLMAVLRGPRSVALTHWPSRRATIRDVLRFSRDEAWYNSRPGEGRLFVEDAIGTVIARMRPRAGG